MQSVTVNISVCLHAQRIHWGNGTNTNVECSLKMLNVEKTLDLWFLHILIKSIGNFLYGHFTFVLLLILFIPSVYILYILVIPLCG